MGSKKIKTSLVLNVLPTKPKMLPVTKAVNDIAPIKMFEEEIIVPTKITNENLIEEVLIHPQNFPIIDTHDNNCGDNVKYEIKSVLPTSINKGGILEKILESPIRRLNSNSSIDLMAIQSVEEPKPTTNQPATDSDNKNQFTRKRVIFNLEAANSKPIFPETQALNDESDWNISSFED